MLFTASLMEVFRKHPSSHEARPTNEYCGVSTVRRHLATAKLVPPCSTRLYVICLELHLIDDLDNERRAHQDRRRVHLTVSLRILHQVRASEVHRQQFQAPRRLETLSTNSPEGNHLTPVTSSLRLQRGATLVRPPSNNRTPLPYHSSSAFFSQH